MNNNYAQEVELLLRMMPIITDEGVFAVHGGTAINLFLKDLPRYSVDVDLTYIPLEDRQTSIFNINARLKAISDRAKRSLKGIHIVPNPATCKLLCEYRGKQIKIEVNQTKRGIIGGNVLRLPLCSKAQEEFGLYCEADIVPKTLLYGGKMAAALSRQHPRDLFDIKYMDMPILEAKEGFLFCLLGSDRPIHESLDPVFIDQREALHNQFEGMTDIPFTYEEYEETRNKLIKSVNGLLNDNDKRFLIGFEMAEPDWEHFEYSYFEKYPSVQWKLINLLKLKNTNPEKLMNEADKLRGLFIL